MEAIPRPAATILLLRDGPEGVEVFMVVRHQDLAFAGGALVFPGGRVETADTDLAARAGDAHVLAGYRIAAIRETFEECGVLLARPRGSDNLIDADTLRGVEARHREAINGGAAAFEAMLLQENLVPATDLLVHFAHWITPANQAKRYDTQFFMTEAPPAHLAVHDGREAVDSIWITPQHALAGSETGRFKLIFATFKNLEKLGRSRTVAEAMSAARAGKVVTVQPHATRLEGTKRLMRIPAEADYGGSEFVVDLPPGS